MKYPWLPAIGRDPNRSAWNRAGTDLRGAVRELSASPGVDSAVMAAEALRRHGRPHQALTLLAVARQDAETSRQIALLDYAVATVHWTLGAATSGRHSYGRALETARDEHDTAAEIACELGVLRCRRINTEPSGARDAAELIARATETGDADLRADAEREAAAWLLLASESDQALRLADDARLIHVAAGDRYLEAMADVLAARALNAAGDHADAVDRLRAAMVIADEIDSDDARMVGAIFLGQFLQRGVGPDSPRWQEAHQVLSAALIHTGDPWTRSEILLPTAHLYLAAGMLPEADEAIGEYELLYRAIGGNKVADANIAKFRARLTLAKSGALAYGGFAVKPMAAVHLAKVRRQLRRARRLYAAAGMTGGQEAIEWERHLVDALLSTGSPSISTPARAQKFDADDLTAARHAMVAGRRAEAAEQWDLAESSYTVAEERGRRAGATMLVVAACARQAELGLTRQRPDTTRAATRRAVLAAETLRGAVRNGQARQRIADFLRAHYERAAAIAARLDDPDLVLEIAERLRTERITALLARRTDVQLPHELDAVLDQIDRLNEQLARTMAPSGLTAVRALPETVDDRDVDGARLEADLTAARRHLATITGHAFADIYDAPPTQVGDLLDGLALDVLAILPLDDGEHEYIVTVWWPAPGPTGPQTPTRPAVRLTPMDRDLRNLRSWLTDPRPTARIGQHAAQLKPITDTLPTELTRLLTTDRVRPTLVVPAGWLWGVPFPALPLTDDLTLIDRMDLALTPSLRVHATTRARPPAEACRSVVSYALPDFAGSDDLAVLSQFPGGHHEISDVAQLLTAVTKGGSQWQLAVLATHGNREPGLAQGLLTTDRSTLLTASQFLTPEARPPAVLSMAACHGLPRATILTNRWAWPYVPSPREPPRSSPPTRNWTSAPSQPKSSPTPTVPSPKGHRHGWH